MRPKVVDVNLVDVNKPHMDYFKERLTLFQALRNLNLYSLSLSNIQVDVDLCFMVGLFYFATLILPSIFREHSGIFIWLLEADEWTVQEAVHILCPN